MTSTRFTSPEDFEPEEPLDQVSEIPAAPTPPSLVEEPTESDSEVVADDPYFDDDEILQGDDLILDEEDDFVSVQQDASLIIWEVEGAFNENGGVRKARELRYDPPVLRVKTSENEVIELRLTKELVRTLYEIFGVIYKGYFGIDSKRKTLREQGIQGVVEYFKEHRVGLTFFLVLVLLAFLLPLVNGGLG